MNRSRAIVLAIFLIATGFSSFGEADDDSWLPGFLSDAFKDDLESLGVLRATLKGGVFVELEFKDQKAFFTVIAVKEAGTDPESYSQLKDGFALGYSQNDANIYFDSSIELLGTGNLGVLDSEAETIRIDSTLTESSMEFQKVINAPAEGIYKEDYAQSFVRGDSLGKVEDVWFYVDFDNAKSYTKDDELKKVIEYDSTIPYSNNVSYFTSSNNGFNFYQSLEDYTVHSQFSLSDSSFKAAMTAKGYDRVSEDEYQIALKQEEERIAAEQAMEEKRLADEREKQRLAEAAAAARKLEQERIAEQQRQLALKQARFDDCMSGKLRTELAGTTRRTSVRPNLQKQISKAKQQARSGRLEEAEMTMDNASSTSYGWNNQEWAAWHEVRAFLYWAAGEYSAAKNQYRQHLDLSEFISHEKIVDSLFGLAAMQSLLGEWNESAERLLDWCGQTVPKNSEPFALLSRSYFELGDYIKASQALNKAMEISEPDETLLRLTVAIAAAQSDFGYVAKGLSILDRDFNSPAYSDLLDLLDSYESTPPSRPFIAEMLVLGLPLPPFTPLNDVDYLPIRKAAPIYPRRAQTRGISGYCVVEYTVSKLGTVQNPVPVDCQPEGVFEVACQEAARKFEYAPRLVKGVPVDVHGVQNKCTFTVGN